MVYDELRRLAAAKLAFEKPGQTLQATALVHEAYLRLIGQWNRVTRMTEIPADATNAHQTIIVHELLDLFAVKHPRQAEVAKLRFFLEFTLKEIADIVGDSADVVESDWAFARAWLKREHAKGRKVLFLRKTENLTGFKSEFSPCIMRGKVSLKKGH